MCVDAYTLTPQLRKNDQENWLIKIHPMSSFWKDDIDIIRELFRENNIQIEKIGSLQNWIQKIKHQKSLKNWIAV